MDKFCACLTTNASSEGFVEKLLRAVQDEQTERAMILARIRSCAVAAIAHATPFVGGVG